MTSFGESRLRLHTLIRLRWIAVFGQLTTVSIVWLGLGFPLPIGLCFFLIVLSCWLNVYLLIAFPSRHRLEAPFAASLLTYDILQLAGLLYLSGGIENPFTVLIVAPVTVSAASLPPRYTIFLGFIAAAMTSWLTVQHWPLPWTPGERFELPLIYRAGLLMGVIAAMTFLALYAWRLTKEARQMSAALAATEHILAREQKLHALDGLAAAAAHELGTPLNTIVLIANELKREANAHPLFAEDLSLIESQARRCREILQTLTRQPKDKDPLHNQVSVRELMMEAAAPYRETGKILDILPSSNLKLNGYATPEPIGERHPGMIYGLGNLIENAVDFAAKRVILQAKWTSDIVIVSIIDDGPGFALDIIDSVGEPYVTTRSITEKRKRQNGKGGGLGLGFFIAKTLLERSGAKVTLSNQPPPPHGAIVRVSWRRSVFETRQSSEKGISAYASWH